MSQRLGRGGERLRRLARNLARATQVARQARRWLVTGVLSDIERWAPTPTMTAHQPPRERHVTPWRARTRSVGEHAAAAGSHEARLARRAGGAPRSSPRRARGTSRGAAARRGRAPSRSGGAGDRGSRASTRQVPNAHSVPRAHDPFPWPKARSPRWAGRRGDGPGTALAGWSIG